MRRCSGVSSISAGNISISPYIALQSALGAAASRPCFFATASRRSTAAWTPPPKASAPQLEPLNLPRRRLRQFVAELDPARIFPEPDARLYVLLQFRDEPFGRRAGLKNDIGLGLLQSVSVALRRDGRLQHFGVCNQRLLDFEGRYPDAADLEHVVGAPAVAVTSACKLLVLVAGARPMSLEG